MITIKIIRHRDGKFSVESPAMSGDAMKFGPTGKVVQRSDFKTLGESERYAKEVQTEAGGPDKASIVYSDA